MVCKESRFLAIHKVLNCYTWLFWGLTMFKRPIVNRMTFFVSFLFLAFD